jgi:hypothetical protein
MMDGGAAMTVASSGRRDVDPYRITFLSSLFTLLFSLPPLSAK